MSGEQLPIPYVQLSPQSLLNIILFDADFIGLSVSILEILMTVMGPNIC